MEKRLKEEQISFLQKIKPLLIRSHYVSVPKRGTENNPAFVGTGGERMDVIDKRIDKIEKLLTGRDQDDTYRVGRVKGKILSVIQERRRLNATELGNVLGLSRTRCSEYLRELAMEGKVEGVIVNRKKYYRLVKQ